MTFDDARTMLDAAGQGHVLRFWERLSTTDRDGLLAQISALDMPSIDRMARMLDDESRSGSPVASSTMEPADVVPRESLRSPEATLAGRAAIADGKVGVILVAGGQGSRLGFDGPKGAYPVAPLSEATLFEIHARKILNLEQRTGADVPFYIMTSDVNDTATRAFFEENAYFGLQSSRVLFFTQGMWPALSPEGKIILDRPDHIFMSPDGHGGILSAMREKGMISDMQSRGLSTLFFFQVDNPLVEIADPAFIGLHLDRRADMSVKVCAKRDPAEGLGVVVVRDGRHVIVEYTELTDAQKHETTADGKLRYLFGSVAIHVFALDFLKQEAEAELPLHVAHKKVPVCGDDGKTQKPASPNAYKFEKFIFDVVPHATRVLNVEFAREDEFSPVKNAEGSDSPATCRHDMIAKAARWMESIGVAVPRGPDGGALHRLEIDPTFAASPEELSERLGEGFEIDGDLLLAEEQGTGGTQQV